MVNINDQKTSARDRVRLLDGDVPPDLMDAYAKLRKSAIADVGVSLPDVDAWLAVWMTEYMPAIGGIPLIIIRRDGPVGIDLVRTMLLRGAASAYS